MIDFENADFLKLRPVDYERYADKVDQLLIDGEEPIAAFQTVRDGLVFTNMRVIAINIQGVTGKRRDFTSLPYKRIQAFSIETSGVFDIDSELELWFSGLGKVRFEFTASADAAELCRIIATYALN